MCEICVKECVYLWHTSSLYGVGYIYFIFFHKMERHMKNRR